MYAIADVWNTIKSDATEQINFSEIKENLKGVIEEYAGRKCDPTNRKKLQSS